MVAAVELVEGGDVTAADALCQLVVVQQPQMLVVLPVVGHH